MYSGSEGGGGKEEGACCGSACVWGAVCVACCVPLPGVGAGCAVTGALLRADLVASRVDAFSGIDRRVVHNPDREAQLARHCPRQGKGEILPDLLCAGGFVGTEEGMGGPAGQFI